MPVNRPRIAKGSLIALCALLGFFCFWMAVSSFGFVFNLTASLPTGIWHIMPRFHYQRGDIVSICTTDAPIFNLARSRKYLKAGKCPNGLEPILKPIAAISGDKVTISDFGISVNGQLLKNSLLARHDQHGRPIIRMPIGSYTVAPGQVWLISTYHPASFDSRYFGPLPIQNIQGKATLVWKWPGDRPL